ncbi:MAG TPA: hypothetical protein VE621_19130 [Bryobacteraceae bacterium]|nr:hypothetical protein [Bryobacteraceae bacterium]
MKLHALLGLVLLLATAACNRSAAQSDEAIRTAIVDHLKTSGSGLDPSLVDIKVEKVNFEGNQAKATVSFRPKNAPDAGMAMNYTLESKNGKWEVVGKSGMGSAAGHGAGAGMGAPQSEQLPPGHPPTTGQSQPLPKGHPPVAPQSGQPK